MKTKILGLIFILAFAVSWMNAQAQARGPNFNLLTGVPLNNLRTVYCGGPTNTCGGVLNTTPPTIGVAQWAVSPNGVPIPPCGQVIALSNVRNQDNTTSSTNAGVQIQLPTKAQMAAAGFTTCTIIAGMGTPSANYPIWLVNDTGGTPACITGIENNANWCAGTVTQPYVPSSYAAAAYDGTSTWKLGLFGSPAMMAQRPALAGQMVKDGDDRFFLSQNSSCPQWQTGVTYAGGACVFNNHVIYTTVAGGVAGASAPTCVTGVPTCSDGTVTWTFVAYSTIGYLLDCPYMGKGMITGGGSTISQPQFGGYALNEINSGCLMLDQSAAAGSNIELAEVVLNSSTTINGIAQGSDNGNGGHYIRLTTASTTANIGPFNQMCFHNGVTNLGTNIGECWVVRNVPTSAVNPSELTPCLGGTTCLDLINPVVNGSVNTSVVSVYDGSTTVTTNYTSDFNGLKVVSTGCNAVGCAFTAHHQTNPITGTERDDTSFLQTFVGVFKLNGGSPNSISDTTTARNVVSWHNRIKRVLNCPASADMVRSSASVGTFTNNVTCQFLTLGPPSNVAALGDRADSISWAIIGDGTNNTASAGCVIGAILDGASILESEQTAFANDASGAKPTMPIGLTGMHDRPAEGLHSLAIGGNTTGAASTCTLHGATDPITTRIEGYLWQ